MSRRTNRPYLALAVGTAAAAGVIGAIEAFLHARGGRPSPGYSPSETQGPTLEGPAVSTRAGRVELSMLRLRF